MIIEQKSIHVTSCSHTAIASRILYPLLFLCLSLGLLWSNPSAYAQTNNTFIIGTVSGQLNNQNSFSPFSDYLQARLPNQQFEVKGFATIEALMIAVEEQSLDFAFITPAAYIELSMDSDMRILATITQALGESYSPWLTGAVFAKASNTEVMTLSDASDKKVVALSEFALGGWLSAAREWQDLNIDIDSDLAELEFVFSYDSVIERVCSGEADIGVISANTFFNYAEQCDAPLKVLPQPLASQGDNYQLPHSTRLYPEVAFVMIGKQDEVFIRDLSRAILDIEPDSEIALAVNICGFTAPLPYTEVQALMQELRLGPYSSLGEQTLRQFLSDNTSVITLLLLAAFALVTTGLIKAQKLSKKYQQSELFRTQVFEGSHVPMVIVDYDNMAFIDMNIAAVKQYGYQAKEELIETTLISISARTQLNDSTIMEALEKIIINVKEEGKATFEWLHIRPTGEEWLAEVHLMAFASPETKVIQATVEDITEKKQLEEERLQLELQLEFSQRMESIGRLAGGVAHDFNNLLTVINGYCEILIDENKENTSLSNTLEQIRKAGTQAAELTQKLLTFSRRQSTLHVPVNLALIIEDSAEMIKSLLGEHIELQLELGDMQRQVLSDPGQLQQVLLNLIVNAKDAMPDGGILKIKTQPCLIEPKTAKRLEISTGNFIEMTVSDNGIGMDEEVKKHIFEPFFSTKDSGTGLGLSTVYGIIQQSKGTVQVKSKKGGDTTFSLLLPEAPEQE